MRREGMLKTEYRGREEEERAREGSGGRRRRRKRRRRGRGACNRHPSETISLFTSASAEPAAGPRRLPGPESWPASQPTLSLAVAGWRGGRPIRPGSARSAGPDPEVTELLRRTGQWTVLVIPEIDLF